MLDAITGQPCTRRLCSRDNSRNATHAVNRELIANSDFDCRLAIVRYVHGSADSARGMAHRFYTVHTMTPYSPSGGRGAPPRTDTRTIQRIDRVNFLLHRGGFFGANSPTWYAFRVSINSFYDLVSRTQRRLDGDDP